MDELPMVRRPEHGGDRNGIGEVEIDEIDIPCVVCGLSRVRYSAILCAEIRDLGTFIDPGLGCLRHYLIVCPSCQSLLPRFVRPG